MIWAPEKKQIKELLENTDLTQQAIAESLNVNQSSVSRVKKEIEKGDSLDG